MGRVFHGLLWMAVVSPFLSAQTTSGRGVRGHAFITGIKAIETQSGGRLGVCVWDGHSRFNYRTDERFPMCSTFKVLLVAAILARVDQGREALDAHVSYTASDLLAWAPVTSQHVAEGMGLEALCEATITQSDNTAANLLLVRLGGPKALTRFARSLGDRRTRLDRNEPSLNSAVPGDLRDTTTPVDMVQDLKRLLVGDQLSKTSRQKLTEWMIACATGQNRLRAGLPKGWIVGDKTGSGEHGTTNDVAIFWPPSGAPILIAAYLTGSTRSSAEQNAALADVARLTVKSLVVKSHAVEAPDTPVKPSFK